MTRCGAAKGQPAHPRLDVLVASGGAGEPGHPLDPALDVALGPAMLRRAQQGSPPAMRLYRPAPTLALSRLDALEPSFGPAARRARAHGFEPVQRSRGGRAAAYHHDSLVIDQVAPAPDAAAGIRARFAAFGALLAAALTSLGVDARVGAVPGEYCPGDFSVNAGGRTKLVGTAQRVVRGAWLFSAVVLVDAPDPVREVLRDVYPLLGLDWDPASVGAVSDSVEGVRVADVAAAVVGAYRECYHVQPAPWPPGLLETAAADLARYRVTA